MAFSFGIERKVKFWKGKPHREVVLCDAYSALFTILLILRRIVWQMFETRLLKGDARPLVFLGPSMIGRCSW